MAGFQLELVADFVGIHTGMLLPSPIRPFYPISRPLKTLQQNQMQRFKSPGSAQRFVTIPPWQSPES